MSLYRSSLCALALFVVMPTVVGWDAEAAFIRRAALKSRPDTNCGKPSYRVIAVVGSDNVTHEVRKVDVVYTSSTQLLAVNSEGWTSTTVPVSAKVELTGGGNAPDVPAVRVLEALLAGR